MMVNFIICFLPKKKKIGLPIRSYQTPSTEAGSYQALDEHSRIDSKAVQLGQG